MFTLHSLVDGFRDLAFPRHTLSPAEALEVAKAVDGVKLDDTRSPYCGQGVRIAVIDNRCSPSNRIDVVLMSDRSRGTSGAALPPGYELKIRDRQGALFDRIPADGRRTSNFVFHGIPAGADVFLAVIGPGGNRCVAAPAGTAL